MVAIIFLPTVVFIEPLRPIQKLIMTAGIICIDGVIIIGPTILQSRYEVKRRTKSCP